MSQNDTSAGRLPERKDDRASGVTRQVEEQDTSVGTQGCLPLCIVIVVFFLVSIGFALLTR